MGKLLILMLLCHILDDFVLQPICLSKLKQKSFWEKSGYYKKPYSNDYKMALGIHALSWSISIILPLLLFASETFLWLSIFGNTIIPYLIDDIKANKLRINLITDQLIHIIQIITTWEIFCLVM